MTENTEKQSGKWHGGKGSSQRNVNKTAFDLNWEKIFGNKKPKTEDNKNNSGKD